MFSDWVWQLLVVAVFVWATILTVIVWQDRKFLKKLFPISSERDIRRKFEEVVKEIESFDKNLESFKNKLGFIERDGIKHVQKVELMRYNPYEDTGGDQSFSIALLNNLGDGIVITSLHSRSGTRVFAKPVTKGKSSTYDFSQEEINLITKALKKE